MIHYPDTIICSYRRSSQSLFVSCHTAVVWRYPWLLVLPWILAIWNACSITTRWQTWSEVHTHTHTHQPSVTVYPAADNYLSNPTANRNNPTTPPPVFKCPCNNTSTWQIRHHDVNKTLEISFRLTKTNKEGGWGRVKYVARKTVWRASWWTCDVAPGDLGKYLEHTLILYGPCIIL